MGAKVIKKRQFFDVKIKVYKTDFVTEIAVR